MREEGMETDLSYTVWAGEMTEAIRTKRCDFQGTSVTFRVRGGGARLAAPRRPERAPQRACRHGHLMGRVRH